jgi:hypothetical protein
MAELPYGELDLCDIACDTRENSVNLFSRQHFFCIVDAFAYVCLHVMGYCMQVLQAQPKNGCRFVVCAQMSAVDRWRHFSVRWHSSDKHYGHQDAGLWTGQLLIIVVPQHRGVSTHSNTTLMALCHRASSSTDRNLMRKLGTQSKKKQLDPATLVRNLRATLIARLQQIKYLRFHARVRYFS